MIHRRSEAPRGQANLAPRPRSIEGQRPQGARSTWPRGHDPQKARGPKGPGQLGPAAASHRRPEAPKGQVNVAPRPRSIEGKRPQGARSIGPAAATHRGPEVLRGYCDWKHSERFGEHERSAEHITCMQAVLNRAKSATVDADLFKQFQAESSYWRQVLQRVVAVIKFVAERGLAFRGKNESLGSPLNGNYLGILEVLAEFDPFLKDHIRKFGQMGRGNTSYLSSTICEEFIELMGAKTKQAIADELQASKYYSIIVYSTPDLSHVDQLTFIFRFVSKEGSVVERFVGFEPITSHTESNASVLHKAKILTESYLSDLNESLGQELIQFKSFIQLNNTDEERTPSGLLKTIIHFGLQPTFPNTYIALQIFLTLPVSNCEGERSFSLLSRVKNELRTRMTQKRLNALSLMAIESELTRELDFNDVNTSDLSVSMASSPEGTGSITSLLVENSSSNSTGSESGCGCQPLCECTVFLIGLIGTLSPIVHALHAIVKKRIGEPMIQVDGGWVGGKRPKV
ncbi:unnamed protein product [Menidia menidia]|uniref:(Atlantic silverside) hypothetical protein n=1 Tax=Menidia menidia TaxID=238744 RepID=A0A8S4BPQ6_9TELE|nr:unnamed protein product [Menidia menidia]